MDYCCIWSVITEILGITCSSGIKSYSFPFSNNYRNGNHCSLNCFLSLMTKSKAAVFSSIKVPTPAFSVRINRQVEKEIKSGSEDLSNGLAIRKLIHFNITP